VDQITILVSMPYEDATIWVMDAIRSAASKIEVQLWRVDEGLPIQKSDQAIINSTVLIADVTNANPKVMRDVGFAQAQGKPLILIASSSRTIPFFQVGMRVLIYSRESAQEFVQRLVHNIQQAIEQPEEFLFTEMSLEGKRRSKVFISYSRHDREYLDRLLIHLKPLENDGLIDPWADTRLRAGDRWKKEIENALSQAAVAILLISADFLASEFIVDNELPPILRNAADKGTRIIPLILKPCRFARDKYLRDFQAVNDPERALILLSEGDRETLYDAVTAEVEMSLQRG
jgi:hypothetical protein